MISKRWTLTFFELILDAVSLPVRVGGLAVVDVVAVQVGELGEELEDGFPVVAQVGHLAVEQVETLQLGQLFLEEQSVLNVGHKGAQRPPDDIQVRDKSCVEYGQEQPRKVRELENSTFPGLEKS